MDPFVAAMGFLSSRAGAEQGDSCYGDGEMIAALGDRVPRVDPTAFVVESAVVVGDVVLGADASVWFHAVVRADVERVRIGARTNVQDNATIHVTRERWPTLVGDDVTIGHAAVLHGCTVGDRCLVGIGAVVLDGVVIEPECLVGAGTLLTPGTRVPSRSLVLGRPGRRVRELSADEVERLRRSAASYLEHVRTYRAHAVR
ncbi:MAG TPA: gamma carbonic anhydrase family protein [Candidatus Binatia bacterium]|nr:gamma carbonic anhydrase family protein [Candidatus Binatia bacterium]